MNGVVPMGRMAIVQRLFQGIQDEASVRRPAGAPAYDPSSEGIDDEGEVHEPRPGRDIGEVRHPKPIRRWREELAIDVIARA